MADNDVASVVGISAVRGVTEGSPASFYITSIPAPQAPFDVELLVSQSGDYAADGVTGAKTLTIRGGLATLYTVATVDDSTAEPGGSITVQISEGRRYRVGFTDSATASVADNDAPLAQTPTVTITAGSAITEGGSATFTLTASPAPTANLTVSLNVGQNGDYASDGATGSKTVTIPTSGIATYSVSTVDDSSDETDGSISVAVIAGNDYTVGSQKSASVSVADNDAPPAQTPTVTITAGSAITEGGSATFTLTASPAPTANLTVSLNVGQNGDYASDGATGSKTVTIPTSGIATYSVSTVDDSSDETDGSISVAVIAGNDYTVGSQKSASVSVADNDAPPQTQQELPTCVTADAAFIAQVDAKVVRHSTSGRTDLFQMFTSVAATMRAQDTYTVGDLRARADKQSANWNRPGPNLIWQRIYTELDRLESCRSSRTPTPQPPTVPTVTITAGNSITEGQFATFTLTASPAPATSLSVSVAVTQRGDFAASQQTGTRTVTIPSSGSATLTVATVNDATDEPNGSIGAALQSGSNYNVGGASSASVAVADNDAPAVIRPTVTITAGNSITEGQFATFTLTASPAPATSLSVSVAVTQRGDFAASQQTGTRTVTIPSSGSATLTVATVNDATDEPNGSIGAALQSGSNYNVGGASSASVAVADNDAAITNHGQLQITVSDATVKAGGLLEFTVELNRAPRQNLIAVYTSRDGSAKRGTDYVFAVGPVRFSPRGPLQQTVTVETLAAGSGKQMRLEILVSPTLDTPTRRLFVIGTIR